MSWNLICASRVRLDLLPGCQDSTCIVASMAACCRHSSSSSSSSRVELVHT